jgi:hypothetical protein
MTAMPPESSEVADLLASIRYADLRFLLPELVRTATVAGSAAGAIAAGLERAGIEVVSAASSPDRPDLAVTGSEHVERATQSIPEAILADGSRSRRQLRGAGYEVTRLMLRPDRGDPSLVIVLAHRNAARYALLRSTGSARGWKRWRNFTGAWLAGRGMLPATAANALLATRRGGRPLLLSASERAGVPAAAEWFLTLGRGDELSRNAFHLFPARSRTPAWVLKFARVAHYREPFDRDEHGLALAAGEPVTAAHAPRLLARFEVDGRSASVETAAVGEQLARVLQSSRGSGGLQHVDRVAEWLVDVAAHTRAEPRLLDDERRRLATEVVPRYADLGVSVDLVDSLPPVPAVLQHNDLGCWNVVVDGASFVAVDWESARRHGLPLWDMAYFLADAFATSAGVDARGWEKYVVALFGGRLPESRRLAFWLRRSMAASEVPPASVGTILTLGWLHHGISHLARSDSLSRAGGVGFPTPPRLEAVARIWLTSPGLGPGWRVPPAS